MKKFHVKLALRLKENQTPRKDTAMTRKDYIAIAKAINSLSTKDGLVSKRNLVDSLSHHFVQDNRGFDLAKFDGACYAQGK